MRYALGILAQCGVFGSLRQWCADHRRHHAWSDRPGDTHSPYVDERGKALHGAGGLKHAHFGWAYDGAAVTNMDVYAKGLIGDPVIDWCHKTRWFWFAFSVVIAPALWGYAWGGLAAVPGTVLIAGFLRIALVAHAILGINSFGHRYGYQNFDTGDQSRNNWVLGYLTLGEGWHNNHHAHPRAAINGVRAHEIDMSGWIILAMEKLGLVWNVQRPVRGPLKKG
jgi:stearoyl-CoA desaturase (delta-9 desaturase)